MATTTFSPTFTAGGLISGLDTNTMIDKLSSIQAYPITQLRTQQSALKSQISALGALGGMVSSLASAAKSLATSGIASATVSSSASGYSLVAGAGAVQGSYDIQVTDLAVAAKSRSAQFTSAMDTVRAGTLQITAAGVSRSITLTEGMQLADVAKAINTSGLQVSASVLVTGSGAYLSVANLQTGFDPKGAASDALQITETSTPGVTTGTQLGFSSITTAKNAQFTVDGLSFTRQSNVVSDAISGTTLTLRQKTSAPETATLTLDASASQAALQHFVDAYNGLQATLANQLAPGAGSDTSGSLAGDQTARDLQAQMQQLTSAIVGSGSIRSLADMGVKTDYKDGSLSIDATAFSAALQKDPTSLNAVFNTASTGLGALTKALDTRFNDPLNGEINQRTLGMETSISDMDTQAEALQSRVDAFKERLTNQFAAMEDVLARLQATGQQLDSTFGSFSSSSSKK